MKPYGKKHKKSFLNLHDSNKCYCEVCNNSNWKNSKSRERGLIKTELQYEYEETDLSVPQIDGERL